LIKSKSQVTYFSVAVNILLTVAKLTVGLITGSTAILSESAHSASDLITSFISLFSVREAEKPPDKEHPYGHGKYENIGSFLEAIVIFGSGIYIIYRAVREIIFGVKLESLDLGILVMLVSAIANWFISSFLLKKGREFDSPAITADGWHSRTDVFTASGVFASLIIVRFTRWTIIDPIIAIVVSFVILIIGIRIGLDAFRNLVDTRLPPEVEKKIKEILKEHSHEFLEYHTFRTRKAGSNIELDFHMVFPDEVSLFDAHTLTEKLEKRIGSLIPHSRVLIHTEPCNKGNNIHMYCRYKKGKDICLLNGKKNGADGCEELKPDEKKESDIGK